MYVLIHFVFTKMDLDKSSYTKLMVLNDSAPMAVVCCSHGGRMLICSHGGRMLIPGGGVLTYMFSIGMCRGKDPLFLT